MKFRAVIKKKGEWRIGWFVDLSGVNAQEKAREGSRENDGQGTCFNIGICTGSFLSP